MVGIKDFIQRLYSIKDTSFMPVKMRTVVSGATCDNCDGEISTPIDQHSLALLTGYGRRKVKHILCIPCTRKLQQALPKLKIQLKK